MQEEKSQSQPLLAIQQFRLWGDVMQIETYGSGHINDTYLVTLNIEQNKLVILQRINHSVFKQPEQLMNNIEQVTSYLREQIIKKGGDPERETLNIVQTKENKPFYKDEKGNYWRCYQLISDAVSYDQVESPQDFYESAVAFGNFQKLLKDYPANTLCETIPDFHNTKVRFETFLQSVAEDKMGRAAFVQDEIDFVIQREGLTHVLIDLQEKGELPLRVTHNDTKLNNIMMDKSTRRGLCVIDLDTVMPGLAVNDFGDSIRFGASTAAEDEKNLDIVECSMKLFELYAKGFIEGVDGCLTKKEIQMLPMGAKVMSFECGMRFLADYLDGDIYFKTHRPDQNLDRCRTQFKLVADMEKKWDIMQEIIKKYS